MISSRQQAISTKQKTISIGYRKLIAWQKADVLAHRIYDITETFPKSEMYGLTSQLRRAALSVPANIVEGYARMNKNEFRRFLSIALGSLTEVEYFLDFAHERGLIKNENFNSLMVLKEECGRIIWSLYISQK